MASDDDDVFVMPRVGEIHDALIGAIGEMLRPLAVAEVEESPDPARLERLRAQAPDFAGDRVPYDYVERATSADRSVGDSLHLLVMDGHRALNRLQAEIATETLDGASVYGDPRRRPRAHRRVHVRASSNRPAEVRPSRSRDDGDPRRRASAHPERHRDDRGPRARRRGRGAGRDRHLHRRPPCPRLAFFQDMLDGSTSTGRRRSVETAASALGAHHLATGRFEAPDRDALAAYLAHLGSRLVFLIDWNRARKRLVPLVGKKAAVTLLRWAADAECGHRAFLELGGERLVFAAVEQAMKVPPAYGTPLRDVLGADATVGVLQFALQTTAQGLLEGKSHRLIRDELRVELLSHLHAAQSQILEATSEHGSLVVEAAQALRSAIIRLTDDEGIRVRAASLGPGQPMGAPRRPDRHRDAVGRRPRSAAARRSPGSSRPKTTRSTRSKRPCSS